MIHAKEIFIFISSFGVPSFMRKEEKREKSSRQHEESIPESSNIRAI